jgi:predicted 3-demethylubiquinone-9 3-methyltransferase (glyoxalase superfamily)
MDGPNEHHFTFSEGISFVLNCDTQEEIDFYWEKFSSDGGEESRCGWCKDKFGISWQIIPSNLNKLMTDPEKGQRVIKELLKMNKLDMSILENA